VLALALNFVEFAAHQTLDRENGVLGVGDRLPFGGLPDQALAGFGERYDGRGGAVAFRVGDDFVFPVVHDSHAAVRCAQVDTQNLTHD